MRPHNIYNAYLMLNSPEHSKNFWHWVVREQCSRNASVDLRYSTECRDLNAENIGQRHSFVQSDRVCSRVSATINENLISKSQVFPEHAHSRQMLSLNVSFSTTIQTHRLWFKTWSVASVSAKLLLNLSSLTLSRVHFLVGTFDLFP